VQNKKYYDLKLECMVPAIVTYRVLAESAEQASTLCKDSNIINVKYKLSALKKLKLMVYEAGSCMLKLVKNW